MSADLQLEGMWWETIVKPITPGRYSVGFQWWGTDSTLYLLLQEHRHDWNVPDALLDEPVDTHSVGSVAKPSFEVAGVAFIKASMSMLRCNTPAERRINPVSWMGETVTVCVGDSSVEMSGPVAWAFEQEMRNWHFS